MIVDGFTATLAGLAWLLGALLAALLVALVLVVLAAGPVYAARRWRPILRVRARRLRAR